MADPDLDLADAEAPPRPVIGASLSELDNLRNAILWLARQHGWAGDGSTEFARLVGANDRSVRRWLSGEARMSGEVLTLLICMLADAEMPAALREDYEPSDLPISESMDRMLFALRLDPTLLQDVRPAR